MSRLSDWPVFARTLAVSAACMIVVLVWSATASLIFLVGTNLLNRDSLPLLQFWQYWFYYGLTDPMVGRWLKIAATLSTALPLLMLAARVARKGWPGRVQLPLHGETRWATHAELVQGGLYEAFRGLYVGQDTRGRYLRFGGPEHIACYAPTRSGKGVGLVIPNCLLYESTLVCLDVKKENWAATAGMRARAGQKVFLFDPLAADGCTARYNPFSYVRRNTIDAFDDIQRIAQMVFPYAAGDQQFWTDSARSAFVGAACFIAESPELPLTFGDVLRLLASATGATSMRERIEARRLRGDPYTEATVNALDDYLRGSADLVNSIRKTITARLALWFNPRIDAATAESDFDLRELRRSLHAVYVGVTPDNIARLRPLLALFFQQLIDVTIKTTAQHDPRATHQVLLLLDEFPLLGPMPVLADAFSYIAGYDIRIMLIMQSKAQLRDRDLYGPDKAAAILDNCGLEVVFGTKDHELACELSKRLGNDTVEAHSRSGPRFWQILRRHNLSMTASDRERALLLPQEIVRLHPLQALLLRPGMYPIRCRRIRHYNDPTFMRLLLPPPEISPIPIDVRLDQGARPAPASLAPSVAPSTRQSSSSDALPAAPDTAGDDSTVPPPKTARYEKGATTDADPRPNTHPAAPKLQPHQSDGLLNAIMGTEVDLRGLGLSDGKAAVTAMIDAVPTVEALAYGRRPLS